MCIAVTFVYLFIFLLACSKKKKKPREKVVKSRVKNKDDYYLYVNTQRGKEGSGVYIERGICCSLVYLCVYRDI